MFRTIWDWLEIEETRDRGAIRKAYARQAKKYHPEEMPEEARQLREAYKRALSLAAEDVDTGFGQGGGKDAGGGGYRHEGEDAGGGCYKHDGEDADGDCYEHDEKDADGGSHRHEGKDADGGCYRHDGEDADGGNHGHDGKDTGSGYRYGYGESNETPTTSLENEHTHYRYGHGTSRHVTEEHSEKSGDNNSQYHYGIRGEQKVPPENIENTERDYFYQSKFQKEQFEEREEAVRFDYYQLDMDKAERLKELEERLGDLYHSAAHGDLGLWADAVKNCLTEEDLKDTHMVAAVLSGLTQMRNMNDRIWYILQKELFRYCGNNAEWTWLKSQFAAVRRENSVSAGENASARRNIVIVKQIDPITGQEIPEKPALESHGWAKYIIIALVIINFVVTLILAYIFS